MPSTLNSHIIISNRVALNPGLINCLDWLISDLSRDGPIFSAFPKLGSQLYKAMPLFHGGAVDLNLGVLMLA